MQDLKYKVVIDSVEVASSDITEDNDWIKCKIKPNAKKAVITLSYNSGKPKAADVRKQCDYSIDLGYLRSADLKEGQEDRFGNLGYFAKLSSGSEPTFDQAFKLFQVSHGIDPDDAKAAEDAVKKLKELTGDRD